MESKLYYLILNLAGISPLKFKNLIEKTKNVKEIFNLNKKELIELGLNPQIAEKIIIWDKLPIKEEIDFMKKEGIDFITIEDKNYPLLLKEIYDPPYILFIKGKIEFNALTIALVGTRTPSLYGIRMAEKFSRELACLGITTVSGLARGIDTAVHIATINAGGKTIGVMGSGFRNFYPPENKKIEKEIIKNGGIITEYASYVKPIKYNFPKRNRIISGLSKGVVIIEAGPRSGALITAYLALEQGREVFALPGRIDTPYSKGTNKLLKEGATLIENVEDILNALNLEVKKTTFEKKKESQLDLEEIKILSILENPLNIEEISSKVKENPQKILFYLTQLQIKGLIEELPGKIYKKK